MCATRTYTRQQAQSDTSRCLARLHDEGIHGPELDDASAFALAQWDQWPDHDACTGHPKAG